MPIPPASFDAHLRVVDLTKLVSSRTVIAGLRTSRKYRAIASSMQELDMVGAARHPPNSKRSHHVPLAGRAPTIILRAQGTTTARCLVAKDDEAYTYNKRIDPLSTIQEHRMIMKEIGRAHV